MTHPAVRHRMIGRVLGFPECCVERWIEDMQSLTNTGPAVRRGTIELGPRSPEEVARIEAVLGEGWLFNDTNKYWVPCTECMDHPRWTSWEESIHKWRWFGYLEPDLSPKLSYAVA